MPATTPIMSDDTLIHDGAAVKALDGEPGRIGGYLVLWGSPESTDAARDYFEPDTDFGRALKAGADVLFHHGLPKVGKESNPLADRVLGDAELKADETGLWMEAVLALRDDYERRVYEMVKAGKLGLSSGTASHLMRRLKQANGARKIVRWPIVEASITPTPAEPRTSVFALKSLMLGEASPIEFDESTDPAGAVAAPTVVDRFRRLVADRREFVALCAKLHDQRRAEGRDLSTDKRDALKALQAESREIDAEIARLVGAGVAPEPAPEPFDPVSFAAIIARGKLASQPSRK